MGKQNLYEHSLRVPLIFAGPGIPAGQRHGQLVWHADTSATLLDVAGVDPDPASEGRSLLPILRGDTHWERRTFGAGYRTTQRMMRDERYKLIRYFPSGEAGSGTLQAESPPTPGSRTEQLFDLAADPWETVNLACVPELQAVRDRLAEALVSAGRPRSATRSSTAALEPLHGPALGRAPRRTGRTAGVSEWHSGIGAPMPVRATPRSQGEPMSRVWPPHPMLPRRLFLAAAGMALATRAEAAGRPAISLGLVQFGTVQWIAEMIRRHRLDTAHGFTLDAQPLASPGAGRVAIMGGALDVVVLDWLFVAVQRAKGAGLCFAPFSSATGGVVAPAGSNIRTLADLAGKRLGVAGGPVDKSWLILRAAARKEAGLDLATAARVSYAAPPLLGAQLEQGKLDAVLTYWTFVAKLEAAGHRQAISVADSAAMLGLPRQLGLVGFVFREGWARAPGSAIEGFLAAAAEASAILASGSSDDWQAVRPLMDAADDRLFAALRTRFAEGVGALPDAATQERNARALFAILKEIGGTRATGGLEEVPAGLFWQSGSGAG